MIKSAITVQRADTVLRSKAGATLAGCTRRIVATYALATPEQINAATRWYVNGADVVAELAETGNIDRERAAVVIAHLSPQTPWSRNIAGARQLVREGRADHCMGSNITRAMLAMNAPDPWDTFGARAPKTRRFALNLLGRTDVVTVDVWAARVALGRGWGKDWRTGADGDLIRALGRTDVYEALELAYRRAAKTLQQQPSTVQAATWIVARNGRAN
jgi:hypothetical protein